MALEDVRSARSTNGDDRTRTIFFTPAIGGDVEIAVAAAGLSDDVELALRTTTSGRIVSGKLRTSISAGQRTQIEVTFTDAFAGPIELSANGLSVESNGEEA